MAAAESPENAVAAAREVVRGDYVAELCAYVAGSTEVLMSHVDARELLRRSGAQGVGLVTAEVAQAVADLSAVADSGAVQGVLTILQRVCALLPATVGASPGVTSVPSKPVMKAIQGVLEPSEELCRAYVEEILGTLTRTSTSDEHDDDEDDEDDSCEIDHSTLEALALGEADAAQLGLNLASTRSSGSQAGSGAPAHDRADEES